MFFALIVEKKECISLQLLWKKRAINSTLNSSLMISRREEVNKARRWDDGQRKNIENKAF